MVEVICECIGVHWPNLFLGTGVPRGKGGARLGQPCAANGNVVSRRLFKVGKLDLGFSQKYSFIYNYEVES